MKPAPEIGRVFTPDQWAMWLLKETGAFQAWLDGAAICDPTFGEGAFVVALFELANRSGIVVTPEMVSRVFGCEINPSDKPNLFNRALIEHRITLHEDNFRVGDVINSSFDRKFDVLIGNPPWANFSALPLEFRQLWGKKYLEYGLVKNRKDVLLGNSRADIAVLIIKKLLDRNLVDGGKAAFFLPLSIFFNSGSNDLFRPYPGSAHGYAITEIWDFGDEKVFPGISTRYGAANIAKSVDQDWPVPTHVRERGEWTATLSTCSDGKQGFWQRHNTGAVRLIESPVIQVFEGQQPRQGINTCGATDILLFTKVGDLYRNALGDLVELEKPLIYPLIDKSTFSPKRCVQRFILVAHDNPDGRPLTLRQMSAYPKAMQFLTFRKSELERRKGTMLHAHLKRGQWWALLGVGPYSFAPWKVVWEALGKSAFKPKAVPGSWQGNQALHAYCPCNTEDDALRLVDALSDPSIQAYLLASAMGGTMNWAQPGRIGKLFNFDSPQRSLFA